MTRCASDLYLALDQGGHSSRALVFDGRGVVQCEARCAVATQRPKPGWVEHDADALSASLRQVVDGVALQLGARTAQVKAMGLATQRSSVVCWDRVSGAALSPVLSWQDSRNRRWLDQFQPHDDDIQRRTGLSLSPFYGASKLRWCLDHLTAVQQALAAGRLMFGPLAAFLAGRLVEQAGQFCDPANASRTLLYDPQTRQWSDTLLRLFDLPRSALPRCVPSRYRYGDMTLGSHAAPLNVVSGDQSAALFSGGMPEPDVAYVNIGTGAFVQRVVARLPTAGGRLLKSVVFSDDRHTRYAVEGTVNGAASALAWLEQQLGVVDIAPQLESWLTQCADPPLFINAVSGLGTPYLRADIRSRFIGEGDVRQQAVAVVESTLFLLRVNLDAMCALLDPPRAIRISGGLAQVDALCQRLADLTGVVVQRSDDGEATARGLAFLLADCPADCPANWVDSGGAAAEFAVQGDAGLQQRYGRWLEEMDKVLGQGA